MKNERFGSDQEPRQEEAISPEVSFTPEEKSWLDTLRGKIIYSLIVGGLGAAGFMQGKSNEIKELDAIPPASIESILQNVDHLSDRIIKTEGKVVKVESRTVARKNLTLVRGGKNALWIPSDTTSTETVYVIEDTENPEAHLDGIVESTLGSSTKFGTKEGAGHTFEIRGVLEKVQEDGKPAHHVLKITYTKDLDSK